MKTVKYLIEIKTDPGDLTAKETEVDIKRLSVNVDKYNVSNPINDKLGCHHKKYKGMDAELFIDMFKSMCLDNDYTDSMKKLEDKESDQNGV